MQLHLVKVKCTVLQTNVKTGKEEAKKIPTCLVIRNAGTFGNAETEVAKHFGSLASPENNYMITGGIAYLNVHSILIAGIAYGDEELNWYKIKVQLTGDGKPFSNLYLVQAPTMQLAQERIRGTFTNTSLECDFKTSAELKVYAYLELEGAPIEEGFVDFEEPAKPSVDADGGSNSADFESEDEGPDDEQEEQTEKDPIAEVTETEEDEDDF